MNVRGALGLMVAAATFAACDTRFHPVGARAVGPDGSGAGADGPDGDGGIEEPPPADAPVVPAAPLAISAREAVTRVAQVLWESPPDSAWLALADSGRVTTDVDVREIARTMLADPRAAVGVGHFYRWWLELDRAASAFKEPAYFPQFSAATGALMGAETEALAVDVTLGGEGRFETLMRASYSFLNETLAGLYGVPGVVGSDLRKVDLDPTQRAGIFTQLSVLTSNSGGNSWTSPSRRGLFVSRKMLCLDFIPPPDTAPAVMPNVQPPLTNRQRIELTVNPSAACAACHRLFDPLGFAFEKFDSIGRTRLTDSGMPIDTTGHIVTPAGDDFSFDGPIQLAAVLAGLPTAHRCMSRQWLAYVLGRTLSVADDPEVTAVHERFAGGALNLRTLIAAAVSSSVFLAENGGPPCTPGLRQTCNDEPFASWTTGTCSPAGKCLCDEGRTLNVTTGRCR